jgi:choline kinase
MKAIVLAAGTGSRLGEITKARTKGMVPVNGKKLIDYLLDFFETEIFERIFVVGGFHYEDLKNHITNKKLKNVVVIENKEYLKGNIFTLITALKEFSRDSFLITNVDHIYPHIMFKKMKENFTDITAMCDFDRTLTDDDMKIKLRSNKYSIDKISKALNDFDCGYIGMTYVDKNKYNIYKDALDLALKKFGDKAVVENILQVLADNEATSPAICDLSGFGWYEVDTIEDLRKAEATLVIDKNFI